jgi:16S rRNA processing protein RimM
MVLEGCVSREDAEVLRGMDLCLRFEEVASLPEGEYYYWQILGLKVLTEDGEELGEVAQILETGANDVYVVRAADGKEVLLPAIPSVIRHVDLDEGHILVTLLPGLLEL